MAVLICGLKIHSYVRRVCSAIFTFGEVRSKVSIVRCSESKISLDRRANLGQVPNPPWASVSL